MQTEVERDPLNASYRAILAHPLHQAGMHAQSIEQVRLALDIDENSWVALFHLAQLYIETGQFAEAVAAGEKAYRIAPWSWFTCGSLAAALVLNGENDRAQQVIRNMGDGPASTLGRVIYHVRCSEIDTAADWYEKAIEQRDPFAVVFARTTYCEALRKSPRWSKLAGMMNLPE